MRGEGQSEHEGAEVAVDAHGLEGDIPRPQSHDHAEEHEQFAASDTVEDPGQQPHSGDEENQGQGPRARRLLSGDRDEGDGREILEDEDRNRDLTVVGPVVRAVLEDFDHEDGGRERQCEAQ